MYFLDAWKFVVRNFLWTDIRSYSDCSPKLKHACCMLIFSNSPKDSQIKTVALGYTNQSEKKPLMCGSVNQILHLDRALRFSKGSQQK